KPHRSVLERERPALIAMASETSRLVRGEGLNHPGPNAPMRVMAINAAHRAFRHAMAERLLKLCDRAHVAARALRVDGGFPACDQRIGSVNFVAARAADLVLCVAALNPAHVRRLVQMAAHADLVDRRRRELPRIPDILSRSRFSMLRRRPVARFACL